jgi:hypothetical protein
VQEIEKGLMFPKFHMTGYTKICGYEVIVARTLISNSITKEAIIINKNEKKKKKRIPLH